MNSRSLKGFTLIEMLITGLISVLVGVGLWTLIRASYDSQYELVNRNAAAQRGSEAVDTIIDTVRMARTITAAAGSDITITDDTGRSVRFWRASDQTLRRTVNGAPIGGAVVVLSCQSLSFTYWSYSGSTWTSSSSPSSPSGVGAVDVVVTGASGDSSVLLISSAKLVQHRDNNLAGF